MGMFNSARLVAFGKRIVTLIMITELFISLYKADEYLVDYDLSDLNLYINTFYFIAVALFSDNLMQFANWLSHLSIFIRILFAVFHVDTEIAADAWFLIDPYYEDVYNFEIIEVIQWNDILRATIALTPKLNMVWVEVAYSYVVYGLISKIILNMKKQAAATSSPEEPPRRRQNNATHSTKKQMSDTRIRKTSV